MKKLFLSFILFSNFLLSNQTQRYFDDEIPALNQNRNQNRNSVNIQKFYHGVNLMSIPMRQ